MLKSKKLIVSLIIILTVFLAIGSVYLLHIWYEDTLANNTKSEEEKNNQVNQDESNNELTNDTYQIRFDSNGGSYITSLTIQKDEKILKPNDPIRAGYKFLEWTLNDETFNFEEVINANITLKASWEKIKIAAPTPKLSTIDKINLNDFISARINYVNYGDPFSYYFATNWNEVFPSLAGKDSIVVAWDEDKDIGVKYDLLYSEWESGLAKLQFDEEKEKNAYNTLKEIEKTNYKGITFHANLNDHGIFYEYMHLTISNPEFASINTALQNIEKEMRSKFNVFEGAIYVDLPGAGEYPNYNALLDEDVCEEYHLVCEKW